MWNLFGFKSRHKKGEKVEAAHSSGKYLPAVVTEVYDNGQYFAVEFEGGEKQPKISGKFVRHLSTHPSVMTSKMSEISSRTITTNEESSANLITSPSTKVGMRKSSSIGKLSKKASSRTNISEKDADGKSLVGTPTESRRNSVNIKKQSSLVLNSRKGSISSPERVGSPSSSKGANININDPMDILRSENPELFLPNSAATLEVQPKKERKERGKEEILLLSRIRKCREEVNPNKRKIDISRLNIEFLPLSLQQIADLRELICRKNPLTSLDPFRSFSQLERLDLSFTENVALIPGWSGFLDDLVSLRVLELNNVNLADLPEEMRILKRLEKLSLRKNNLNSLPPWMMELRYLYYLDLSNNQFEQIPAVLNQMKSLSDLILKDNPCDSLDLATPEIAFLLNKRSVYVEKDVRKNLTHRAIIVREKIVDRLRNEIVEEYVQKV